MSPPALYDIYIYNTYIHVNGSRIIDPNKHNKNNIIKVRQSGWQIKHQSW